MLDRYLTCVGSMDFTPDAYKRNDAGWFKTVAWGNIVHGIDTEDQRPRSVKSHLKSTPYVRAHDNDDKHASVKPSITPG